MCNFCMLVPPTPTWGGYITKKYTYFRKKERPALEGDTFNSYPYPSSTAAMFFFFYLFRYINFEIVYQPRLFSLAIIQRSQQFSTDPL